MSITSHFEGRNRCPVKNIYQGTAPRVLFICSAGLLRSPTGATLGSQRGWNTRAAGSHSQFALIPVTETLLEWADLIVFVNPENEKRVNASYPDRYNHYTCNIKDDYSYMDPELVKLWNVELDMIENIIKGLTNDRKRFDY